MVTKSTTRPPALLAETVQTIALDLIDANPSNPRENWDAQQLDTLAPSLRDQQCIQPIIVRPKGKRFEIVDGERRFRASSIAKLTHVPAIVRPLSDGEALTVMLVTNIQRKGFNPLEKARAIQTLCMPTSEGGAGKTREQVGKLFGKTGSWASNCCRMLQLPPAWQQRIAAGEIGESQARLLVPHAEQPQILAAIETDMAANPWAWAKRVSFERSLAAIVDRDPLPTETAIGEPVATQLRRETKKPAKAAPAAEVKTLCDAIAKLSDIEALKQLRLTVRLRIEALSIRPSRAKTTTSRE